MGVLKQGHWAYLFRLYEPIHASFIAIYSSEKPRKLHFSYRIFTIKFPRMNQCDGRSIFFCSKFVGTTARPYESLRSGNKITATGAFECSFAGFWSLEYGLIRSYFYDFSVNPLVCNGENRSTHHTWKWPQRMWNRSGSLLKIVAIVTVKFENNGGLTESLLSLKFKNWNFIPFHILIFFY